MANRKLNGSTTISGCRLCGCMAKKGLTFTLIVLVSLVTCLVVSGNQLDDKLSDSASSIFRGLAKVNVTQAGSKQEVSKVQSQTINEPVNREAKFDRQMDEIGKRRVMKSIPSARGGQLEAFSTDWTGLGDLEASDALKKMNRRSLANNNLRKHYSPSHHRYQPTSILSKRAQLYSLQQVETPATDRILGPILLSRRTNEDLLPEPEPEQDGLMDLNNEDKETTFPLLGEFGSKISLLTTRKMEPSNGGGTFGGLGSYRASIGMPPISEVWTSGGSGDDGVSMNENELMAEDEAIPVSSQVLISPQQLNSMRDSVENAIMAASGEPAGAGVENDGSRAVRLRLAQVKPEVDSIMESLSSNYLPRIARKVMM